MGQVTSGYEGSGSGRRLAGWQESDTAISALLAAEGDQLRRRCRGLVRKNCWATSAQESYVANCIGAGITPKPLHSELKIRQLLKDSWSRWCDEADADGRTDFYGLQALALREIFEAGEVLSRFRPRLPSDGLLIPMQIQMLEAEHLPLTFGGSNGGNSIRAGIEFTPFGKRAAYHLYREHPGLGAFSLLPNAGELVRVDASSVLHIYRLLRAGQMRGQPWLSPVMITLYELDKYVDATLQRQALSNMFIAWQRALSSDDSTPIIATTSSVAGETATEGVGFGEIEGGTILDLSGTGQTLEWSDPPDPSATLPEFVRVMLRCFCSGIGMPYEQVSWDLSQVNYSSIRSGMVEFRRRVEQFQFGTMVFGFCRPIWRRFIDDGVIAGVIPKPKTLSGWQELYACEWRTPAWAWVDPLKDVLAKKEEVRCGFTSRSAVILDQGEDPEQVDASIAADKKRAEDKGLVFDSDAGQTANNGAAQAAQTAADQLPAAPPREPVQIGAPN